MRYAMRRSVLWSPLLVPFGGTADGSFVDVEPGRVRFRFGWGFDQTIGREQIADAYRTRWPLIFGIGWRIGGSCVGLIGSRTGVVEVVLRAPRRARVISLPYTFRRIAGLARGSRGFSRANPRVCDDCLTGGRVHLPHLPATRPPHRIRLRSMPREHVFIPMADGVRLHATLYFPDSGGPWPAVLEALPYRKDDVTASYRPEYVRLAEHGYTVCRVDVRGTGTSEGLAEDEYPAEGAGGSLRGHRLAGDARVVDR